MKSSGYEDLEYWTESEIYDLYIEEGYSPEVAEWKAFELYHEIRDCNKREIYSWNKARDLGEFPAGTATDLEKLAATESIFHPDDFADAEGVWETLELLAPKQGERETPHYEKLRKGVQKSRATRKRGKRKRRKRRKREKLLFISETLKEIREKRGRKLAKVS
jgi:hypothetical protein